MQPSKPRTNKDKPKHRKPSRFNGEQPQGNYMADNKRKGAQTQLTRRAPDPPVGPVNRGSLPGSGQPIYKQDLLQKGFETYHSKRNEGKAIEVAERHPECFNRNKRKVICETGKSGETTEMTTSQLNTREELKEDFGHLLDNEDIPDWFVDNSVEVRKASFDFGCTVDRTRQFFNQKKGQEGPSKPKPIEAEVNFDELDKLLEKKYKESKTDEFPELNEAGLLEEFTGVEAVDFHSHDLDAVPQSEEQGMSMNDSGEYFKDLHGNLKKAMLKYKQFSSGDEKDSDESFQESLGFEAKRDRRAPKPTELSTAHPTTDQLQYFQSMIHPVDPTTSNILSFNMTLCDDLPQSVVEANAFKEAVEKDEVLRLTEEEKQQRQQLFLAKYGYLDPIMCQLCYEILVSRGRQSVNELSVNGFNQKSVERYCANKYKIFSLFLQGDIISKVWFYKEPNGKPMGPFMAFDMDIWNSDSNFFKPDVLIALEQSPFLGLQFWIHRSNLVLKIVDNFFRVAEDRKKLVAPVAKKWRKAGEQKRYDKRVSFNKKPDNEPLPPKDLNEESLTQNFSELFPPIEEKGTNEPLKSEKKNRKKSESGDVHLLDALRASLPKERERNPTAVVVEQSKKETVDSEKVKADVVKKQTTANDKSESSKKQNKGQKTTNKPKPKTEIQNSVNSVYVKKELAEIPEDIHSKTQQSSDKQKTNNIKQMLGLNF